MMWQQRSARPTSVSPFTQFAWSTIHARFLLTRIFYLTSRPREASLTNARDVARSEMQNSHHISDEGLNGFAWSTNVYQVPITPSPTSRLIIHSNGNHRIPHALPDRTLPPYTGTGHRCPCCGFGATTRIGSYSSYPLPHLQHLVKNLQIFIFTRVKQCRFHCFRKHWVCSRLVLRHIHLPHSHSGIGNDTMWTYKYMNTVTFKATSLSALKVDWNYPFSTQTFPFTQGSLSHGVVISYPHLCPVNPSGQMQFNIPTLLICKKKKVRESNVFFDTSLLLLIQRIMKGLILWLMELLKNHPLFAESTVAVGGYLTIQPAHKRSE